MEGYAESLHLSIDEFSNQKERIEYLKAISAKLPSDMRISYIDLSGKVLYDNDIIDYTEIEIHSNRPEILNANYNTKGTHIRQSASTHKEYFYYAQKFDKYFLRVSLPYTIRTRNLLHPDPLFIL